jgi:hypothetical protein
MKLNIYTDIKTYISYNFQSGILTKHSDTQHTNYHGLYSVDER